MTNKQLPPQVADISASNAMDALNKQVEAAYKEVTGQDMTAAQKKVVLNRYVRSSCTLGYIDENIVAFFFTADIRGYSASTAPAMMVFTHKALNPQHVTYFPNEDARKKYLLRIIENHAYRAKVKAEEATKRKAWKHSVKVGDIFYTSWGYEQTNIDFYQVTKLVGDKHIEVRKIASDQVRDQWDGGTTTPIANGYQGEAMTKLVQKGWSDHARFKIASYANAHPWDGAPKRFSDGY